MILGFRNDFPRKTDSAGNNRIGAIRPLDGDLKTLDKGKPFESHKQTFYRCIREGGLPVSDV